MASTGKQDGEPPYDVEDLKQDDLVDVATNDAGTSDETVRVVDHIAERALCRKFDFRILPVLSIMCKCPPFRSTGRSS